MKRFPYYIEDYEVHAMRTEFIEDLRTYHGMKFEALSDETTYAYQEGHLIVRLCGVGDQEVEIEVGSSDFSLVFTDEIDYDHAANYVARLVKAYKELCDV